MDSDLARRLHGPLPPRRESVAAVGGRVRGQFRASTGYKGFEMASEKGEVIEGAYRAAEGGKGQVARFHLDSNPSPRL